MKYIYWMAALAAAVGIYLFTSQASNDEAQPPEQFIANNLYAAMRIAGEPLEPSTLEERMAVHNVPGVSVAFLRNSEVEWTLTAGVRDVASGEPVDVDTMFQAASISKPVFATTLMLHRQNHTLDLDADINSLMSRWQLPAHEWQDSETVTLRRLLSHSAGTTVHGFRGYAAGEDVPTIIQLLDGAAPSESAPVIVDIAPGSRSRYSGGGTTIAQLAFEDQSGLWLTDVADALIFAPLGMTRSAYSQPLSDALRINAATPYNSEGAPITGGAHDYAPIMAAAGLWTTPSDLMRLAGAIQRARQGENAAWMTQETANSILTRQHEEVGIGFFLGGDEDVSSFSHGGSNAGFRAHFFAHTDGGDGVAIMTNGANGGSLIREILIQIGDYYDWVDGAEPVVKLVAEMTEAEFDAFTGRFQLAGPDPVIVTIDRADETLVLNALPYLSNVVLRPEGDDVFFAMNGMSVEFGRDDARAVSQIEFYGELGLRIDGEAQD
jgi:CubicO group peptidase (beta-lactamase class C family)